MIYRTFIVVAATLLLAPAAQALPASFTKASIVSTWSREDLGRSLGNQSIIHCGHETLFKENENTVHRYPPRNVEFPNIFYLPRRRDTADKESEYKETDVNLLSYQNDSSPPLYPSITTPAVRHTMTVPNTSMTSTPKPTLDSHRKIHPVIAKKGKGRDKVIY